MGLRCQRVWVTSVSSEPSVVERMPQNFITLCTMLGSGTRLVPPGFVNQTLQWLAWHRVLADRVVLQMDNLPKRIGTELQRRSPVPLDVIYDTDGWIDPRVVNFAPRQALRFARCLRRLKGRTTWAGFIDTDEFVGPDPSTFRAAVRALPPPVDWIYLTWNHVCAATGTESYPLRYAQSGKSFVRPAFFRDDRHEGKALRTNGIVSRKSNSVHKWVPLPGPYRAAERMALFSRSPHAVGCGSAEVGNWTCRWTFDSHELRHVRSARAYRTADC